MTWYWATVAVVIVINLITLPFFLFLLTIAVSAILRGRGEPRPSEASSRFLIVIPAHNEESGIKRTVESCLASDYPSLFFSVVVIADNCNDLTGALAHEAGARVVERVDDVNRSKGFAIEYLFELLTQSSEMSSLDAIVIVDADTVIDADLLTAFDAALHDGHDWLQAYYTVANPEQSWRTRLMTYAFSLFNGVMQLGQNALGSSAGFKGNGMCFAVRGLRRRPWKAYGLVEDMEFSWMLRVAGEKITFLPEVAVYGAMVASGGNAAASQRRRWEFGRVEIRGKYLGPLVRSDELDWSEKLVSACELVLPPMTVLAVIYAVVLAVNATTYFTVFRSRSAPMSGFLHVCDTLTTLALAIYAFSPFIVMRLPLRYLPTIALAPFYMAWKSIVALGGRPKQWVRTPRDTVH